MASKTKTTETDAPTTEEVATAKPSKWEVLATDRAAWIAANARPAVSTCLCGCGSPTKGRFFPGHDATLKETLKVTAAAGGEAGASAEAALATFGW
jgi:hypothetical protein